MSSSSSGSYARSYDSSRTYKSSDTPSSGSSLSTVSDASSGARRDAGEPPMGWWVDATLALPHNLAATSRQWVESIVNDDSITTEAIVGAAKRVTDNEHDMIWEKQASGYFTQGKREFTDNFNKFKKAMTQYLQHGGSRNGQKVDEIVRKMVLRDVVTNDHERVNYNPPSLAELLFDAAKDRTHVQVMPNAFRHVMHAGAAYANSEQKAKKDPTRASQEAPGRLRRLMREARANARELMMVQTHKRIRPGSIVPLNLRNPKNAKRMRSRSKQSIVALPTKPKQVPHPRKTASRKKAKRTV